MSEPTFLRIEMPLRDRRDLAEACYKLGTLVTEIDAILKSPYSDDEAVVLARHKIRTTSQQLRNA